MSEFGEQEPLRAAFAKWQKDKQTDERKKHRVTISIDDFEPIFMLCDECSMSKEILPEDLSRFMAWPAPGPDNIRYIFSITATGTLFDHTKTPPPSAPSVPLGKGANADEYRVKSAIISVCDGHRCHKERRFMAERRIKLFGLIPLWWPVMNADWCRSGDDAMRDIKNDRELRNPPESEVDPESEPEGMRFQRPPPPTPTKRKLRWFQ